MHANAAAIGGFTGGLVIVTCLAILFERLLGRRMAGDVARAMVALAGAWVTAGVLGGFGFARDGEVFTTAAFGRYLVPALAAAPIVYLRARGRRNSEEERGGR